MEGVATLSYGHRVRSALEDGSANSALCALVAADMGVPASRAKLTVGAKSRVKQFAVAGDAAELIARLQGLRTGF